MQDKYFLTHFEDAYRAALAKLPAADERTRAELTEMMGGVHDELALHTSFAERWGVDMARVVPSSATLAYTDFLDHTAQTAEVGARGMSCGRCVA